jgi:hypothetical protein
LGLLRPALMRDVLEDALVVVRVGFTHRSGIDADPHRATVARAHFEGEVLHASAGLHQPLHALAIAGVDVQCRRVGGEQRFAARERSVSSSAGLTSTMRPPAELP